MLTRKSRHKIDLPYNIYNTVSIWKGYCSVTSSYISKMMVIIINDLGLILNLLLLLKIIGVVYVAEYLIVWKH